MPSHKDPKCRAVGQLVCQGPRGFTGATGATGPTGDLSLVGINYSDYVYWDERSKTWKVGDETVHLGAHAGEFNRSNNGTVAIGSYGDPYRYLD